MPLQWSVCNGSSHRRLLQRLPHERARHVLAIACAFAEASSTGSTRRAGEIAGLGDEARLQLLTSQFLLGGFQAHRRRFNADHREPCLVHHAAFLEGEMRREPDDGDALPANSDFEESGEGVGVGDGKDGRAQHLVGFDGRRHVAEEKLLRRHLAPAGRAFEHQASHSAPSRRREARRPGPHGPRCRRPSRDCGPRSGRHGPALSTQAGTKTGRRRRAARRSGAPSRHS